MSFWAPIFAVAWAVTGACVCAVMAGLEPSMLEEGFILDAARRMLRGDVLYRDVVTFTGPVPYEMLAALFAVQMLSVVQRPALHELQETAHGDAGDVPGA